MHFLALSSLLNFAACAFFAVLAYWKCPDRRIGRASAFFNIALGFYSFFYALWQNSHTPATALLNHEWLFVGVIWIQQAYLFFILTILHKAERQRILLWLSAAANIGFTWLNFNGGLYTRVEPTFGIGYWPVPTSMAVVYIIFWHAVCFYGFGLLIQEALVSGGRRRIQMLYLLTAYSIGYSGGASNWLVWFRIPVPPYANCLIAGYVAVLVYATVKHQFLDITVVIRKTLIYTVLSSALFVMYLAIIAASTNILVRWLGAPAGTPNIIASLAIAFLFYPIRKAIQAFVDKKFFRHPINVSDKILELTTRVMEMSSPETIARAFFDFFDACLFPSRMILYLRDRDPHFFLRLSPESPNAFPIQRPPNGDWSQTLFRRGNRMAFGGDLPENIEMVLPLKGRDGLMGFLFLGPARSDLPYGEEELRLINTGIHHFTVAYEQWLNYRAAGMGQQTASNEISRDVIHEVRSPFANIVMPSQALTMELEAIKSGRMRLEELLPKMKQHLQYIVSQTVKAQDRVEALRDLTVLDDPKLEPVDLSRTIRDSLDSLAPLLAQHNVLVSSDLPAMPAIIMANAKQLEIVWNNLFKNAAEAIAATVSEGQERRIWISSSLMEEHYEVVVRDSGPGIKPEDLKKIFDLHFTTKGTAGTGVGLHLTRQLIEALGGRISVDSPVGQGAVFRIMFPAQVLSKPI